MPDNVQLRPVADGDLPIFFEHQRDPQGVHMAAFTVPDPDDRAAFDDHWRWLRNNPTILMRTIAVNGQPAGHVSSYVGDVGLEVTYWLGREYWGRGIATAALQAFLLIETHRPLRGRAAADNAASLRVMEKCGFVRIGDDRGYANARRAEIDEVLLELTS
ncbi:MAG: GNAT family N-acetyltransferase [Candidatus Promineofilum sp.]|nr:GNAT family N-acetyltransferase [Promineifilum sp.]